MAKKKNKNNTRKTIVKKENNIKEKSSFKIFMSKKYVRITLHIITAIVWILFLVDFSNFERLGGFPNAILSILALVTLLLEWEVINDK
ncbi:hypothetical protein [Clostridium sp. 1001271B_151109_B4]|uniref:hypothetical protein n=1 Tax=Clostridium sp. 1001271B_151109_B4 TaxID=2787148 RepID=UPI0018AC4BC2|nr:hypothetical protein [Clostridium sp. 1001271B_151109_B4]